MNKIIKSFNFLFSAGLSLAAFAAAEGEESQKLFGLKEQDPVVSSQVKILGNVDIAFTSLSSSDSKMTFTGGADVAWMFTPSVGAFAGIDYNPIRSEDTGVDFEVNYLDIPFGVAFDFLSGSSLSVGNSVGNFSSIMNVGLYAGMPLSKLKYEGGSEVDSKLIIGLNIEGHANYQLAQNFGLGFHAGLKWGFNDVADSDDIGGDDSNKPFGISAGLSMKFL